MSNLTWTIQVIRNKEPKPIMIGSNIERELDFWLKMNRNADRDAMRSTGAKRGARYSLKAYLHESGQDFSAGKLTEFRFDDRQQRWI